MADIIDSRIKYIRSFNDNMLKIWKERIALLKVIDTGSLYNSLITRKFDVSEDGSESEFEWRLLTYGVFQDMGTGREVPRGNPGDIGRPKVRRKRQWLSPAFWSSAMNIKEFLAESFSQQTLGIFSNALHEKNITGSIT